MRVIDNVLSFNPKIPKEWKSYSFKVNFRNKVIKVNVAQSKTSFEVEGASEVKILVNGEITNVYSNSLKTA